MATNNNVIELNGIAYDALTGEVLGSSKQFPSANDVVQAVPVRPVPSRPSALGHGRAIDGFVSAKPLSAQQASQGGHLKHHRQQPTKTLMRHAVKSPQHKQSVRGANNQMQVTKLTAYAPIQPTQAKGGVPARAIHTKVSSDFVDLRRAGRAADAQRSAQVSHFIKVAGKSQSAITVLTAQDAKPADRNVAAAAPGLRRSGSPNISARSLRPQAYQPANSAPRPQAPVATPSQHSDQDQDIFQKALAQADSHQQPAPKESVASSLKRAKRSGKKRRLLAIAGSVAVFIGLCGFVAYQNKANIQLQMASAKAGFSAAVPLYKPDGFAMGKLDYATGAVNMSYSNGSNGAFNILQKKSNWDSQTLLENFVATTNQPYQGYQSNGRTIYVYGEGNATWVNGGIWYQIKDAKGLTNDQLVKVAASM